MPPACRKPSPLWRRVFKQSRGKRATSTAMPAAAPAARGTATGLAPHQAPQLVRGAEQAASSTDARAAAAATGLWPRSPDAERIEDKHRRGELLPEAVALLGAAPLGRLGLVWALESDGSEGEVLWAPPRRCQPEALV
mmetsp:Transcript_96619/g.306593  ORF Transcript_96619/g.306593 Transcript_96619/m.306593 type:complete len:138 (+) Transcript_96619:98-511(+)